jgi:molecular chaperone DnaJ
MSKDYYKILGVEKNATADEIKKAYRKMAMKYHPDKNDGDVESEAKFKEMAEAYDVLSTPDKKSNYDRYGSAGGPNGTYNGGFGGFDMGDIFSNFGDIFGNAFNQRYSGQRPQSRGSNLRIKVSLTIDEILKGTNKKIKYKRQDKCNTCSGKGGTDVKSCLPCNGSGQRTVVQNTPFGQIRQSTTCPDCGGSGQQIHNKCKDCKGDGTILNEQSIDVSIPAGVSNGMQLNMQGYGNHIRNGLAGDLHIIVEEIRDNSFIREGNNIIVEKTISVIDAILGINLKVNTPHGEIPITIEPGTEHGKVIRISGRGIPDIQLGMGDLFVKINIKIPKKIELDEQNILEKLKKSKNFQA